MKQNNPMRTIGRDVGEASWTHLRVVVIMAILLVLSIILRETLATIIGDIVLIGTVAYWAAEIRAVRLRRERAATYDRERERVRVRIVELEHELYLDDRPLEAWSIEAEQEWSAIRQGRDPRPTYRQAADALAAIFSPITAISPPQIVKPSFEERYLIPSGFELAQVPCSRCNAPINMRYFTPPEDDPDWMATILCLDCRMASPSP